MKPNSRLRRGEADGGETGRRKDWLAFGLFLLMINGKRRYNNMYIGQLPQIASNILSYYLEEVIHSAPSLKSNSRYHLNQTVDIIFIISLMLCFICFVNVIICLIK